MELIERFLKYVSYETTSSEASGLHPSSEGQRVMACELVRELTAMGVKDVYLSEGAYVYATIPASADRVADKPLGFLAHVDTSEAASGKDVKPRRVVYQGGVLPLGTSGRALDPKVFPELDKLVGKELIVTDGTTLLGADDKLGVAILMTLAEELMSSQAPSHREVRLCFTPDEEIGEGTHGFEPARFGAKLAFTLDGSAVDEIENANFNAASAKVVFKGVNVHPGSAKNVMVNALKLAAQFVDALPADEAPETTCLREGFYHPVSIKGCVGDATLGFILRDHDAAKLEARKQFLFDLAAQFNAKYAEDTVTVTISDQYRNMEAGIAKVPFLVEAAKEALQSVGLEPHLCAIRGGTDGAFLTEMGIPCPNLGTGGRNFHGECEYAVVPEAVQALAVSRYLVSAAKL